MEEKVERVVYLVWAEEEELILELEESEGGIQEVDEWVELLETTSLDEEVVHDSEEHVLELPVEEPEEEPSISSSEKLYKSPEVFWQMEVQHWIVPTVEEVEEQEEASPFKLVPLPDLELSLPEGESEVMHLQTLQQVEVVEVEK